MGEEITVHSDYIGPGTGHGDALANRDRQLGQAATRMFRLLFGFDVFVALVVVGFFVMGLLGDSVSGFNATIGAVLLTVLAALLGGAWGLRAAGRVGLACAVLALIALPAGMVASMMLVLVVLQINWR